MTPLKRHLSDETIDSLNEWTFACVRCFDEADFREFMRGLYFIVDEAVRVAVEAQRAESTRVCSTPSDN
jgi:hypothetical protein